jgi:hypothetical protein
VRVAEPDGAYWDNAIASAIIRIPATGGAGLARLLAFFLDPFERSEEDIIFYRCWPSGL